MKSYRCISFALAIVSLMLVVVHTSAMGPQDKKAEEKPKTTKADSTHQRVGRLDLIRELDDQMKNLQDQFGALSQRRLVLTTIADDSLTVPKATAPTAR
jgi:hypothetical protein